MTLNFEQEDNLIVRVNYRDKKADIVIPLTLPAELSKQGFNQVFTDLLNKVDVQVIE